MRNRQILPPLFLLLLFFLHAVLPAAAQQPRDTKEMKDLYGDAEKALRKRDYRAADSIARAYCDLCEQTDSLRLVSTYRYSRMLECRAACASSALRFDRAAALECRVLTIREKAPDCDKGHIAAACNELSTYLARTGDYDGAVEACTRAVKLFAEKEGEKGKNHATALCNLASHLSQRGRPGDAQRAASLAEKAVRHIPKGTLNHANALNTLAALLSQTGNLAKADEYGKEAAKEGRKLYGTPSAEYATMLSNQAVRLATAHNYAAAIATAQEARETWEKLGATDHTAYARLLANMASFHLMAEHFAESEALLKECEPLLKRLYGGNSPEHLRCLSQLANVYSRKGEYDKAESVERKTTGSGADGAKKDTRYALALSSEAETAAAVGNYGKAVKYETAAADIFRQRGDSLLLAASLSRRCSWHTGAKDYDEAVDDALRSLSICPGKQDKEKRAQTCNNLSIAYYYKGDHDSAYQRGEEAVALWKAAGLAETSAYAKALLNLALYASVKGQHGKAALYGDEAAAIQRRVLGDGHPDNASLYYNLANFHNTPDGTNAMEDYYDKALTLQSDLIRKNFSHQTAAERERFWETKRYLYKAAPAFAFTHPKSGQLAADAYNAKLFTTGLLLNSEINFRSLLLAAKDSAMLEKFNRLDLLRREVEACWKLPVAERAERQPAAEREAERLEKELVVGCKEYGDFMAKLSTDYRQVAAQLKEDDAAVEFDTFESEGRGTAYIALYLRKGWAVPRVKQLFTRADLEKLRYPQGDLFHSLQTPQGVDAVYRDTLLTRLVWKPVLDDLPGVRNVYFAPAGLLYQLAAEYLPLDSTRCIGDEYRLYRVSTTATAGLPQPRRPISRAAVFGGVDYQTPLTALRELHESGELANEMAEVLAGGETGGIPGTEDLPDEADVALQRAGFGYLPGTLVEAESMGELLMQNNVPTLMRTGQAATEEAFKALAGKDFSLIHIATHGFYYTPGDAVRSPLARAVLNETGIDDKSLSYAGLLLSGAQTALRTPHFPKGIEDGILTAREISLLNFPRLDIVTLSACKTGVGEVTEEGVYGLQRAFKKAGAKTLVMSLWNVDDRATQQMMGFFYEGLAAGKSKHEAFRDAQRQLRQLYAAPSRWAAFILLDGAE